MMTTRNGQVKKTSLEAFSRPRVDGIIAISITDDDQLLEAHLTDGHAYVLIASSGGRAVQFNEEDQVRPMGRNTRGVRGITLEDGEHVVGTVVSREGQDDFCVLTVSQNGYGKRTPINEYPVHSRGGKGVITHNQSKRTGPLVAVKGVHVEDDLMIVTEQGLMIRMDVAPISQMGRNTQGVRLINLKDGDTIADVTRVVREEEEPADEDSTAGDAATESEGSKPSEAAAAASPSNNTPT